MPVTIIPMSEVVLPVATENRLLKREYVIEGGLRAPCRALLVGRTLVNGGKKHYRAES
jgi:hypothetical protein